MSRARQDATPADSPAQASRFRLETYRLPAGEVEPSPTSKHHICMHVGAPVATRRSLDGRTQRRVQLAGDFDIVPCGMAGRWRNEAAFELLLVEIDPEMVRLLLDDFAGASEILPGLRLRDPHLYQLTLALRADAREPGPLGRLYSESLMTALLARLLMLQGRSHGEDRRRTARFTPAQQQRIVEFIEENIAAPLTLPDLAELTGYGLSRFKTLFGNSFGIPPHAYVLQRRVERARELIQAGALPLSQVALETGFAHQSHMASALRRYIGVPPRRLRLATPRAEPEA